MRRRPLAGFGFFALLLSMAAACGESGDSIPEQRRQLTAVERLRIGSVDDPATSLTTFDALELGEDGRIYTVHPQDAEVRIHTPDGTPAGAFGGRGDGPGEFQSPAAIGIEDGQIWVLDERHSRVSWFTVDGEFVRDQAVRPPTASTGSNPTQRASPPFTRLENGSFLARAPLYAQQVASGEVAEAAIFLVSLEGAILDTVAMRNVGESELSLTMGDRNLFVSQLYSDEPILAYSPATNEVISVDRRTGGDPTFLVTRWGIPHDSVFDRVYPFDPIPLPAAIVDSAIQSLAGRIADAGLLGRAETESQLREKMFAPPHYPAVQFVRAGRDRTTWLALADRDGAATTWVVLLPSGDVWGEVALPQSFSPVRMTRDEVWGMERDALDVPYIVRYELRPTDPA